ncbi:MAG: PAS domain S-box protein, partial [Bacteroidales bacterium]
MKKNTIIGTFSIQKKFWLTSFGIFLILLLIVFFTNHYIKLAFKHYSLMSDASELSYYNTELSRLHNSFLLSETINPDFFNDNKSTVVDNFNNTYTMLEKKLASITQKIEKINAQEQLQKINQLEKNLKNEKKIFDEIIFEVRERGFTTTGIIGKMRTAIHNVESYIYSNTLFDPFKEPLLMLRRHEKDYMLRKDMKYKEKYNETLEKLLANIEKSNTIPMEDKKKLNTLLSSYKDSFYNLIQKDLVIGNTENEGLLLEYKLVSEKVTETINEINSSLETELQKEISQSITLLFVFFGLFSMIIIIILLGLSKNITGNIALLKKHIRRLGNGELPDKIKIRSNDEIGEMIQSVNQLTDHLRHTCEFANEVGKGRFESHFEALHEKDILGNALVNMRQSLLLASQEEAKRKKEQEIRSWVEKGYNIIAKQLQQFNDVNSDTTHNYTILKTIIEYIGANIGALYIVKQDDTNEIYLDLTTCYAYNRNKIINHKVFKGEGYVWLCYYEKSTYHLSKLSNDYIKITSGIGNDNPKELLLTPLKYNDEVCGVIEIASFEMFEPHHIELLEKVSESLASTLMAQKIKQNTDKLLQETKRQAELLKQQDEEMKQTMESMMTEREEATKHILDLEQKLNTFYSNYGYMECSENGTINYFNTLAAHYFMLDAFDVKKLTVFQLIRESFTNDESFQQFWIELKNGRKMNKILRYSTADKQKTIFSIFVPIVNKNGTVEQFIILLHEYTANNLIINDVSLSNHLEANIFTKDMIIESLTKQLQDKTNEIQILKNTIPCIFENCTESVLIVDNQGKMKFANKAMEKISGYSSDDIVGRNINEIIYEFQMKDEKRYLNNYESNPMPTLKNNK